MCGGSPKTASMKAALAGAAVVVLLAVAPGLARAQGARVAVPCPPQYRAFVNALTVIDGRLTIGLNHASYANYLAKAQIAYNQTPFKSAPISCVALIGVPAERALNDYVKANNSWAACLSRVALSTKTNCQSGPGYASRRFYWSDASKNITKAVNNLE
jgi:hypothetical protein